MTITENNVLIAALKNKKMLFASTVLTLCIVVSIQSRSTKFLEDCIDDKQCRPGERCIPDGTGLLYCQQASEEVTTAAKVRQIICKHLLTAITLRYSFLQNNSHFFLFRIYNRNRSGVKMMHNVLHLTNVHIPPGLALVNLCLRNGKVILIEIRPHMKLN